MPFEANIYDLNQTSINPKVTITPPEMYIPLWWYSGSGILNSATGTGVYPLSKGSMALSGSTSSPTSANKHHILNLSWNPNLKYALEVSISVQATSTTAYAKLWDYTSGTEITGASISTTATTLTVTRSGQFTLTPGHVYGVAVTESNSTNGMSITDASLIIFPS